MFHDWRIYEYYTARYLDLGVFDKSNVPMTQHNMKLFTMQRTEVSMADFIHFV
jgi:formylglycine-generating enzyme required for sulfatase activity